MRARAGARLSSGTGRETRLAIVSGKRLDPRRSIACLGNASLIESAPARPMGSVEHGSRSRAARLLARTRRRIRSVSFRSVQTALAVAGARGMIDDPFSMAMWARVEAEARLRARCIRILRCLGIDAVEEGILIRVRGRLRRPPVGPSEGNRLRRSAASLLSSGCCGNRCNTCNAQHCTGSGSKAGSRALSGSAHSRTLASLPGSGSNTASRRITGTGT